MTVLSKATLSCNIDSRVLFPGAPFSGTGFLRACAVFLVVLVSGCAVSTDSTVIGGPAITSGKAETNSRADSNLPRTLAVLPFDNKTDSEFAYTVVRRTMVNHFSTKNYRMLHWKDIDNRLALAGIEDASALKSKTPAELRQILGVDGLLYGDITHYNKTFAGVYSQISVGVELRFLNADDEVVWEIKNVKRSHAGGVSTTPVGLIMNALVAAKHLYGDINLYRAADDLGRDLAKEMPEPKTVSRRAKPLITNVVHSGVAQYLNYGDTLEIGIEGSPGMKAAASIDGIGIVDLEEVEPGQYVGSITLDSKHNVVDVAVVGRLQDDYGQSSSWVSPYGLLNIDNIAPGIVAGLKAVSQPGAVSLSWNRPEDADTAGYLVSYSRTENGESVDQFQSSDSSITLQNLPDFQQIYVSVIAEDNAGNKGAATTIVAIPAPDTRFSDASLLSSDLPATISGVNRLTVDNSPYYLRSKSSIAISGVLLIAPGVKIVVSPNARLSVLGEIHSFGNMEHPVLVTGADGQIFNEFLLLMSSQSISLKGLKVIGAGIPIQINAGSPLISDCVLADSEFNGLTIAGASRPTIRNCTISGAKASGVIISGQAQPTFESNTFLNNDPFQLQNGSNYQVDVRGNTFEPEVSAMTFLGDVNY